jgi:hypothetical protein
VRGEFLGGLAIATRSLFRAAAAATTITRPQMMVTLSECRFIAPRIRRLNFLNFILKQNGWC